MEQRYANILFDDAFKVVVCAPGNERLLIKLIETLIPEKSIMHLELQDKENHGLSLSEKKLYPLPGSDLKYSIKT